MSETVFLIFELIGTVAFALSGAATAMRKGMDIFGVCILALTTATGGGVIRDLILGKTPPATFLHPIYAIVALATALIAFLPPVRHFFTHHHAFYDHMMLLIDSIGLGVFTMTGIRTAYQALPEATPFLLLFVGVVTGVGGGVMRDIMAGEKPYILVKHFYATASLLGALAAILLWHLIGSTFAILIGALLILLLRFLAAIFHWNLPHAKDA